MPDKKKFIILMSLESVDELDLLKFVEGARSLCNLLGIEIVEWERVYAGPGQTNS
jgi:hypothetical protein